MSSVLDVPLVRDDALEAFVIFPCVSNDRKLSIAQSTLETWAKVQKESLPDHIWYLESPRLRLSFHEDVGGYFLHGITRYGSSQDDEEALIAIFTLLSKEAPDAYIRLATDMGEILMILAASEESEPEDGEEYTQCNNWINEGRLLRIPVASGADTTEFTMKDAYNHMNNGKKLLFSKKLSAKALGWISERLLRDKDQFHTAKAYVPRALAGLLHAHPEAICMAHNEIEESLDVENFSFSDKLNNFDITKDLVEVAVRFPKTVFALWSMMPAKPPPWFSHFVPDDDLISYESAILGTQITGAMELVALSQDKDAPQDMIAIDPEDLKDRYSEQKLFDQSRRKGKTTAHIGTLKEEVDESISSLIFPAPVNVQKYIENTVLPSDEEIASWPKKTNSRQWLDEIMASRQEDGDDEEGMESGMKKFMGGINASLEKGNDEEIYGVWTDSSSEGGSDDQDDGVLGEDGKPFIDEDDFFEYFMKEALKLTPEQMEQYRAKGGDGDLDGPSIEEMTEALKTLKSSKEGVESDSDSDIDLSKYVELD